MSDRNRRTASEKIRSRLADVGARVDAQVLNALVDLFVVEMADVALDAVTFLRDRAAEHDGDATRDGLRTAADELERRLLSGEW